MPKTYRQRSPRHIRAIQVEDQGALAVAKEHAVIREVPGEGLEVWNDKHGAYIPLDWGDYLNVTDSPGDVYPITQDVFHERYEEVDE